MGDSFVEAPRPDLLVSPKHDLLELLVYSALFPVEFLEVLGPLEVGHHHPAGVDQDVRQNDHWEESRVNEELTFEAMIRRGPGSVNKIADSYQPSAVGENVSALDFTLALL